MKRLLISLTILTSLFGSLLFLTAPSYAVDISSPACSGPVAERPEICQDIVGSSGEDAANPLFGPSGILTRAIFIVSLIGAVIAVIVIIIAGMKMPLSGGNSDKIAKSRSQIIYAVVGLIVAVLAQALVQFVLRKIT
jgi:ABC-type dipeptide/oligopeptide/nickel transport system permease subunit